MNKTPSQVSEGNDEEEIPLLEGNYFLKLNLSFLDLGIDLEKIKLKFMSIMT